MSERDRSEQVAIVAVACTIVIFLIGLWAGGYNYERHAQHSIQSSQPNLYRLEASPENYQTMCNRPINETHADLCQQWRAAEASTDSARWTQLQFWLGVAGFAGLIATVIYARHAFIQTKIQARAALRANAKATRANVIARDMGHAQVRAYMSSSGVNMKWEGPEEDVPVRVTELKFEWKNHGQSPALSLGLTARVAFVPSDTTGLIDTFASAFQGMDLGSSSVAAGKKVLSYFGDVTSTPITADTTRRWLAGEVDFLIYRAAMYRDIFGNVHCSESCDALIHRKINGENKVNFQVYGHHNSEN